MSASFKDDPLGFSGRACARTTIEMARWGWIEKDRELTVPVLLLHGDADKLIDIEGSRHKSKLLKNPLSKYIEYPGANHVLLEESNYLDILKTIDEWYSSIISSN